MTPPSTPATMASMSRGSVTICSTMAATSRPTLISIDPETSTGFGDSSTGTFHSSSSRGAIMAALFHGLVGRTLNAAGNAGGDGIDQLRMPDDTEHDDVGHRVEHVVQRFGQLVVGQAERFPLDICQVVTIDGFDHSYPPSCSARHSPQLADGMPRCRGHCLRVASRAGTGAGAPAAPEGGGARALLLTRLVTALVTRESRVTSRVCLDRHRFWRSALAAWRARTRSAVGLRSV